MHTEQQSHHSTFDPAGLVLKLRDDLTFSMREYGGRYTWLIEDELNSRFYRVGQAEFAFLSMLDGQTTIADAVGRTAVALGASAVSEDDAVAICRWLVESELASTEHSGRATRLIEMHDRAERKRLLTWLNPIAPKLSLFNPDSLLGLANRLFGWVFSIPVLMICAVLIGAAVAAIAINAGEFARAGATVLAPGNWIRLSLTWVVLKLLHEAAHGIACRRFGGTVREAGVLLLLFMPLPYVDVTSAWRFGSKWQRILTSAAGMLAELVVASIAVIVWTQTGVGVLHDYALNVILMAGLTTLLFNANPLMRFDGYYILVDLLETPNLANRGRQWLKSVSNRVLLGLPAQAEDRPEGRMVIVRFYAVGAMIWRVVICISLGLAAAKLFHGAGLILAVAAVGLWLLAPLVRFAKFLTVGSETQQPNRVRFALITLSAAATVWAVATCVPWWSRLEAPFVVDFEPLRDIRSPSAGFVGEVLVKRGDTVRAGAAVIVLVNDELELEARRLRVELQLAEQRMRLFREQGRITACQVEERNGDAIRQRLAERIRQLQQLTVTSPVAGHVVALDGDALVGTYVRPGEPLLTVANQTTKQAQVMVRQADLKWFRARIGRSVDVRVAGHRHRTISGTILEIEPRARTTSPHAAFSAQNGGPLAVQPGRIGQGRSESSNSPLHLVDPHFLATVVFEPLDRDSLHAGQTGWVAFRTRTGSLGEAVRRGVLDWIDDRSESEVAMSNPDSPPRVAAR